MAEIIRMLILSPLTSIKNFTRDVDNIKYDKIMKQVSISQVFILLIAYIVGFKVSIFLTISNFLFPAVIMQIHNILSFDLYTKLVKHYYTSIIYGNQFIEPRKNTGPVSKRRQSNGQGNPQKIDPQTIDPGSKFQDLERDFINESKLEESIERPKPSPSKISKQEKAPPTSEEEAFDFAEDFGFGGNEKDDFGFNLNDISGGDFGLEGQNQEKTDIIDDFFDNSKGEELSFEDILEEEFGDTQTSEGGDIGNNNYELKEGDSLFDNIL